MYVIHSKKLIYLAQPRTATVSVRSWLWENEKVEVVNPHPMWPPGWGDHHSVNLPRLKELREEGYKTFSCVRNHWDWLVSVYHWDRATLSDPSFEIYLNSFIVGPKHRNLFLLQEDVLFYGKQYGLEPKPDHLFWLYPQMSDVVLRHESQEEELKELLGRDDLVLPHRHKSDRLSYQTYYNDRTRQRVYDLFKPEIEELGYHFQHGGNDGEVGEAEPEPLGSTTGDDG